MKILTYDDMTIEVLQQTTAPASLVSLALQQTMHKDLTKGRTSEGMCKYLVKAEHMSPFEHCSITIRVSNVSRSFLAQVTRQRTFKFTSSSQHYQDYRDYPVVIHPDLTKDMDMLTGCRESYTAYERMVNRGVPVYEARQTLPGAAAVNLIITMDARNIVSFLRQRRCLRNVEEMSGFADTLWSICKSWFPELFNHIGAPCFMEGKCNQGKMMSPECLKADPLGKDKAPTAAEIYGYDAADLGKS